jgi:hypothetical protein
MELTVKIFHVPGDAQLQHTCPSIKVFQIRPLKTTSEGLLVSGMCKNISSFERLYILYDFVCYDLFHILLSCDKIMDPWNVYVYVCMYVCMYIVPSMKGSYSYGNLVC